MRFLLAAPALYTGLAPALSLVFAVDQLQACLFTLAFYAACALALALGVFAPIARAGGAAAVFVFFAPLKYAQVTPAFELALAAPLHSLALTLAYLTTLGLFCFPLIRAQSFSGPAPFLTAAATLLGGVWVFFNGSSAAFWTWDPVEICAALLLGLCLTSAHCWAMRPRLLWLAAVALVAVRLFRFNAALSAHHLTLPLNFANFHGSWALVHTPLTPAPVLFFEAAAVALCGLGGVFFALFFRPVLFLKRPPLVFLPLTAGLAWVSLFFCPPWLLGAVVTTARFFSARAGLYRVLATAPHSRIIAVFALTAGFFTPHLRLGLASGALYAWRALPKRLVFMRG